MSDGIKLESPAFSNGGGIPEKYTSDGDDVNPPLKISGVNEKTQSLVLIMDDPDAATDPDGPGKTFDHWVVFNISPYTTYIDEDSQPPGAIVGVNGIGQNKYIGPAPPNGVHKYRFMLYELSESLNLDSNAAKEEVLKALEPLVIGQALLVGKYQKA